MRRRRNPIELEANAWTREDELSDEGTSSIPMRHIEARESGRYDVPLHRIEYTGYSDYSGGTVAKSNYRVIEKMVEEDESLGDFLVFSHGGYDSNEVLIRLDYEEIPQELLDVVSALADYPLLDDDDHSRLEQEVEDEAYENFGREEWRDALKEEHPDHDDLIDEMEDEKLDELWWSRAGNLSWTAEHTVEGPMFNFKEAAEGVDEDDLRQANPFTGPGVGPHGREHVHEYECNPSWPKNAGIQVLDTINDDREIQHVRFSERTWKQYLDRYKRPRYVVQVLDYDGPDDGGTIVADNQGHGGVVRTFNPPRGWEAILTPKGKRMAEDVERTAARDARYAGREAEVAYRTVLNRAKAGAKGLVRPEWAKRKGYPKPNPRHNPWFEEAEEIRTRFEVDPGLDPELVQEMARILRAHLSLLPPVSQREARKAIDRSRRDDLDDQAAVDVASYLRQAELIGREHAIGLF